MQRRAMVADAIVADDRLCREPIHLQCELAADRQDFLCEGFLRKLISTRRVRWCNGSTRAFGAFSPGSNPGRTANSILKPKLAFDGNLGRTIMPLP